MGNPVVSVVIPVYNGARMIEACLDSVTAQDADMEIIVVDDGSTDNTWAILQRRSEADGRIHPIHQANAGVSSARNRALKECRGEFIRFVDADDVLPAGSMRALLDKAQQCGSDLVIAGYNEVMGPMRTERHLRRIEDTMPCNDMLDHFNRWSNSFFYGVLWNKLFRREIIQREKIEFINGLNWGEDFAFVCRYMTFTDKISYTCAVVYDYQRISYGMTVKQFVNCLVHPLASCRVKWQLYQELKRFFVERGVYRQYRRTLWIYLFRATMNN